MVPHDGTRGSGHTLKHRRFHLHVRKHLFIVKVVKCWRRLLIEIVQSPSLEILKSRLDVVLGSLLWLTLLEPGLGCACQLQLFYGERQECLVASSCLPASLEMEPACETSLHPRKG